MMVDPQLLSRLDSIDDRIENIETSLKVINHELGLLSGKVKNNVISLVIKYVVFPLVVIVGGLAGVKFFLPF